MSEKTSKRLRKVAEPELSSHVIGAHNIDEVISKITKRNIAPKFLVIDLFCGAGKEFALPSGIGDTQWPARPGEYQYEWEEPRTIESGMGCTIDGYNFREDLLRALGNSVVEQTAELAFIDLMRKHLNNLESNQKIA